MKKTQLRQIIKEAINSMAEPTGYYTDQGHKTEENPQDIEYWLKQIEGMSLGDARDYLGRKVGLPSSMAHKVLQQHNTDIVDTFDDFSDEENPFPSSRKGIDQLDKDDLYEGKMKKSQLRQIIKEEISRILKEGSKEVNKEDWEKMNSKDKLKSLKGATDDLDEAEELKNVGWGKLPEKIKNNLRR